MRHTFYNVGHGDAIFIEPDKKQLLIRDLGCYSRISQNKGLLAAIDDVEDCIKKEFSIDVLVSHAHKDHYNGFQELYKRMFKKNRAKPFRKAYIPYLSPYILESLDWAVLVASVGFYLYLPRKSTYHQKGRNWLMLAPLMANLAQYVVGLVAGSGINLNGTQANVLWPPANAYGTLSSKELINQIKYIYAQSDLDDDGFFDFCESIYKDLEDCFTDHGKKKDDVDYVNKILKKLEDKRIKVFGKKNGLPYAHLFSNPFLKNSYNKCIDNHSIVFEIPEEAVFLSDIKEDAMDEMFMQLRGNNIVLSKHYSLLKSSHHGTRICDDLKKIEFEKIVHCCGKGHVTYNGPIIDYNQMFSSFSHNTNSVVFCMDWNARGSSKKWKSAVKKASKIVGGIKRTF